MKEFFQRVNAKRRKIANVFFLFTSFALLANVLWLISSRDMTVYTISDRMIEGLYLVLFPPLRSGLIIGFISIIIAGFQRPSPANVQNYK